MIHNNSNYTRQQSFGHVLCLGPDIVFLTNNREKIPKKSLDEKYWELKIRNFLGLSQNVWENM